MKSPRIKYAPSILKLIVNITASHSCLKQNKDKFSIYNLFFHVMKIWETTTGLLIYLNKLSFSYIKHEEFRKSARWNYVINYYIISHVIFSNRRWLIIFTARRNLFDSFRNISFSLRSINECFSVFMCLFAIAYSAWF